jgi:MFS family permease
MYYIVYIFDMAGYQGNANLVASSIQYVINVVMTIPYLLWVDKWGRRPMFIVGSILMMIWQFALAGTLATYSVPVTNFQGNYNIKITIPPQNQAASKAVIAFCYLFVASFAPTWGPGMWTYISEIFPMRQRAVANGICTAADWIFNFAIGMFTPSAFANITWRTYIVFAVFCFVMTIHVFFLFPETKDKTLEEITQIWDEKIPAWRSASFQPRLPSVVERKFGGATEEKEEQALTSKAAESEAPATEVPVTESV